MIVCCLLQVLIILVSCIPFKMKSDSALLSLSHTNTIRTICCVIVFLSHINLPPQYVAMGYLHFVAVSFFFLTSGYGLYFSMKNKEKYLENFSRRIENILIPYGIVLALKWIFKCNISRGGIFYVNVLLIMYLFFYIVYKFIPQKQEIVIAILVIGYSVLAQKMHDGNLMEVGDTLWGLIGWGSQSLSFLYGILLAKYYVRINKVIDKWKVPICIIATMILLHAGYRYWINKSNQSVTWNEYGQRVVICICLIVIVISLINHIEFRSKFSQFISGVSYEIFLIHGLVFEILEKMSVKNKLSSITYVVCSFVIVVILSLVLKYLVKLILILVERKNDAT